MDSSKQPTHPIILKEYGRNIQNLANYLLTIPDKEKRTQCAKALTELMQQINSSMHDSQDNSQKLWDDLYIMSNFKLDVNGPFPKPDESVLFKKPKKLPYNSNRLYYKHYGRNVEILITKIMAMEREEDKEAGIIYIGSLMKSLYVSWNKESIDDNLIAEHIKELSNGKLKVNIEKVKQENLFSALYSENRNNKKNTNTNTNNKKNNEHYKKKRY